MLALNTPTLTRRNTNRNLLEKSQAIAAAAAAESNTEGEESKASARPSLRDTMTLPIEVGLLKEVKPVPPEKMAQA